MPSVPLLDLGKGAAGALVPRSRLPFRAGLVPVFIVISPRQLLELPRGRGPREACTSPQVAQDPESFAGDAPVWGYGFSLQHTRSGAPTGIGGRFGEAESRADS